MTKLFDGLSVYSSGFMCGSITFFGRKLNNKRQNLRFFDFTLTLI